ncbi:hypothetical protein LIER_09556 [Lithospermum erythrorhizon]|uniref:Leucine-rich repeat-containing N-terminal plant-type domain-containing protein n=1 Tax=Lithospermum erythrorhizon TaxID=34254 RepID=A0AAV3PI21_LITER
MSNYFQFISFLLFYSLYYSTLCPAIQYSHPHDQNLLLLTFKESFSIDQSNSDYFSCRSSYPKTLSWNKSTDCCSWDGVTCDKITGNVVELDLSCGQLSGSIDSNSSLFLLPHLRRLNLAYNQISGSKISMIFGNFSQLEHLNLSNNGFSGQVPSEILKLTELTTLDLSDNAFTIGSDIFKLLLTNFTKLSQVSLHYLNVFSSFPKNLSSSLEIVQLYGNNLHGKLPYNIFHLPNLKTLDLGGNSQLYGLLPSVKWNSHTTLQWLDLSDIQFLGKLPDSIGNLKALKCLDLSGCGFSGTIKPSGC